MMNSVNLVGRMTADAELRYNQSNQAVATFNIAVKRNFKNQSGEYESDFIRCVIWRQQAENLAIWAEKGSLIGITGRIQTRHYDNQQGQRVYVTEIIVESFHLLESRTSQNNADFSAQNNQGYNTTQNKNTSQNQANNGQYGQVNQFGGNPMEISDDMLPF